MTSKMNMRGQQDEALRESLSVGELEQAYSKTLDVSSRCIYPPPLTAPVTASKMSPMKGALHSKNKLVVRGRL